MRREPKRTVKGTLVTELVLALFPLNGRLLEWGDEAGSDLGLSSALWQVLGAVDGAPQSVADIARVMGLARQSVQRSVNVMKDRGLVELVRNPHHRTSPLVKMTKSGEVAYSRVMRLQADWSNEMGQRLRADELRVAVRVLRDIRSALDGDA